MRYRILGSSDLQVSPLCFGGNVFGWTADEQTSFRLLDHWIAKGFNFIDTANTYSRWVPGNKGGESETIIGKWLKRTHKRNEVIIATKVGSDVGIGKRTLARAHILEQAELSLKRLQTDYIDLYLSHYDDLSTPIEETLEAYQQLIQQGKVRYIGASNFTLERLQQSLQINRELHLPRYICLQPLYNLYDRQDFETTYRDFCLQQHLGVMAYYALASGFLTGKYRTIEDKHKSARGEQVVQKYLNPRGLNILRALDEVAKDIQATPSQVALSWLIHQPTVTSAIVSATNVYQLNEIMQSAAVQLTDKHIHRLNEASAYDTSTLKN
ncbi:MAG: aldo/keto reductase [Thermoflavifilum sp.]|nr:aldo/keto reductase [Thermoflavifilum sp.]